MNGTGNTPAVHPKGRSAKAPGRPLCVMTHARCRRCFGGRYARVVPSGGCGRIGGAWTRRHRGERHVSGNEFPASRIDGQKQTLSQFPGGKLASLQRGRFVECTMAPVEAYPMLASQDCREQQEESAPPTGGYIGMGLTRNELTASSVNRVGLRSPLFARRTMFLAIDVAMEASRSATFNRFKASSKATVMAAVSSGPNAVLISRRVIGISLTYGCESQKAPGCQQGSAF
jgi:hypothetical protein